MHAPDPSGSSGGRYPAQSVGVRPFRAFRGRGDDRTGVPDDRFMAVAVGLYTRLPGACRRATGRGGTGGCGAAARVFHGDRRTPGADRQFTGRFRVGNSGARVRFAAAADAANVARSVRRRAVGRRPDHGNPGDPEPRFQKRADPVGQRRYVSRQPGRLVLLHSLQPALRRRRSTTKGFMPTISIG